MNKHIAAIAIVLLVSTPLFAAADTVANTSQLESLYTQLITLLQQELRALQNPNETSLSIVPNTGGAPLSVHFAVINPSRTEAVDFGDGHSTGSNGCTKNSLGYCDLSQPVTHTYQFPGIYTVTLYNHLRKDPFIVSTSTISVTAAASSSAQ